MTRGLPPHGIYAILDGAFVTPAALPGTAHILYEAGIRWFQLRWKDAPARALHAAAQSLVAALRGADAVLVVNDRVDVAALAGAGAHVGQDDLPAAAARALLGPGAPLGLSANTPAEVAAAAVEPVDYLGVGPVFATGTKPDHAAVLGLDGLAARCAAAPWPVVAIGGLTLESLPAVRRAGAAGAALISGLLGAPDLAARARALVQAWEAAGERGAGGGSHREGGA